MKVYLVGGAVRDKLLGLPVNERDWVVVGATPNMMISKGFKPVGKEFPIFLHPETHEEYALARTERKIAKGYKGFTFHATPNVALEDDLKRRDLTINAIAETSEGKLIDPYGGQQDLKNKIMHHVSAAFQEDPVRILRVARLATKFPEFSIHPDTLTLMKKMVQNGEVDALLPERVWRELVRAFDNKKPARFFEVLDDCDALSALFPEVYLNKKGISALALITNKTSSSVIRFATLFHNLSSETIQSLTQRYHFPNEYTELALLTARFRSYYAKSNKMNESELLHFIIKTDALRRNQRFKKFLFICHSIDSTVTPYHNTRIRHIIEAIRSVDIKSLQKKALKGRAFAEALEKLRLEKIHTLISC
ncbi:multifunctional CCA tRNA nucleotidyl transferase/2'3'-cyclic phosphodiesterase/2'nucleotidase/phosphatase [Coxiella endosymbiont of Amblyomma nuttalli]|uniref:multifunctional CCA tRNA nucleotidyl transferase/2'3'-cyclic phosphodiesterase/2'nucleotidase/phosphatase n=1 Tax=Coxiella endosymbiont of Amblyomma nuttalli TaxID=2749996 RepID=UPI001BB57B55|nr:multifunctional CCA tRNA nucleotidyl transferase/2'3'-cyclic phosphodiesterase/2'nucleotidase/phosphatase [Coxiella endosymbiont of Amblyomma nuttalli]QTS84210.1 Multifunctional CCA protein [Coxiella endosymbiont of Amblyomma nuttalli]